MKLSVFVAAYKAKERQDPIDEALASYNDLADEVVVVKDPWPQEFNWPLIGQTFQKGYDRCIGDWVIRCDADYIFHHDDIPKIKPILDEHFNEPIVTFYKFQFILADRYTLKSRIMIAFNKGRFGDDITLDGGGDLCQPRVNKQEYESSSFPESGIPIYNYDWTFKTRDVVKREFGRFARAWHSHFGEYKFGGPSDESALEYFIQMQTGRFNSRGHEQIPIEKHPIYIQDKLKNMTPEMFGWDGWGMLPRISYA